MSQYLKLSGEPQGATRQQAIAKTPADQIPSVIVAFVTVSVV
jgi:hypothetical protein